MNLNLDLIKFSNRGKLEIVKYLVENGANIHAKNDQALRNASYYGDLEIVKYLVKNGADIHVRNDEALRNACYKGQLEVVKYLVKNGADIHVRNDQALRWASYYGYFEIVKYLVENGADIHEYNDDQSLRNAKTQEIKDYLQSIINTKSNKSLILEKIKILEKELSELKKLI